MPSPTPHPGRALVFAGLATAALPAALGALVLWLFPAGCDLRGDPAFYRWACLLPGLMVFGSWLLAPFLMLAGYRRRGPARGSPKGLLAMTLGAGALAHLMMLAAALFILGSPYRALALDELLFLPQAFCVGAFGGAVFWGVREAVQNSRSREAQR